MSKDDDKPVIDVVNVAISREVLREVMERIDAIVPEGIGIVVIVSDAATVAWGGNLTVEATQDTLLSMLDNMGLRHDDVPVSGGGDPPCS